MYYDIIIIGSGISGLYAAYNIQKMSPSTSFIVLEKHKKNWIGGRTSNDTFCGTQVVTGAGIGRKTKDRRLVRLLDELDLPYTDFQFKPHYSPQIDAIVDTTGVIRWLKTEYNKHADRPRTTFKEFAKPILGDKSYNDFLVSAGYTDFENEDAFDVIHSYGMDDNACCWKGLHIDWKQLIATLCNKIGANRIKTSMNVVSIKAVSIKAVSIKAVSINGVSINGVSIMSLKKNGDKDPMTHPSLFRVETDKQIIFESNKVIVATTIDTIQRIVPGASNKSSIYNEIKSQTFLRLYGKFSKKSAEIMKRHITGYTIVPGHLQKIIPMDANKGVYMIAYSDNKHAVLLKKYLENTPNNRDVFCVLIEKALGIPENSLELLAIKDYYWTVGTHYYTPLTTKYENRAEFIYAAQHPADGILVVGEVVSDNQGWTNGALSSVDAVLNKKWITTAAV